MNPQRLTLPRAGSYAVLTFLALIALAPLLVSVSVAVQGATVAPAFIPSHIDFTVFREVFLKEPNMPRWIANSFFVATCVSIGVLITSSLAAYALSAPGFVGKAFFFFIAIGTLMIPFEATIIPNYLFVTGLGWKDSYQGLIVPFLASAFGIFLLRQSFLTIPSELYDAAMIDGCGRLRYLWAILLPLTRPALATLAVYTFLSTYNQYYWPLLITDNTVWRTTQTGIAIFRNSEYQVFNLLMAANLVVMLPMIVLLIIGQRQLVAGLTGGALKG